MYASPDYAHTQLLNTLKKVQKTFHLHIYQVTDDGLCSQLAQLQQNGIDLHLLVSRRIYAYNDYKLAQVSIPCASLAWGF